jgi:hypothetical protein
VLVEFAVPGADTRTWNRDEGSGHEKLSAVSYSRLRRHPHKGR